MSDEPDNRPFTAKSMTSIQPMSGPVAAIFYFEDLELKDTQEEVCPDCNGKGKIKLLSTYSVCDCQLDG